MRPGLAVMYHYVLPREPPAPRGIRPLWLDEFEVQLDQLCDRYDVVGGDELAGLLAEGKPAARPACVLTFDDGTRDHIEIVMPALRKRGLSAIFFLLTSPWESGQLAMPHRVHVLLSAMDPGALWQALSAEARREFGRAAASTALGTAREARRNYPREGSSERSRVKHAVNYTLPVEFADRVLGELISEHVGDEAALVERWLVGPDEARAMEEAGMTIGAHGNSHVAYARLLPDEVETDIRTCHERLALVLHREPRWFAPPFSRYTQTTPEARSRCEQVLRSLRYAGLFTLGAGSSFEFEHGFAQLDRTDCADLPPRSQGGRQRVPRESPTPFDVAAAG